MKQERLKKKLQERLQGGKFRILNEMIYVAPTIELDEYFTLYNQQKKKWDYHPLEKIESMIKEDAFILDIGCGDGLLSKKFKNVINLDLFSHLESGIKGDSNNLPIKNNTFDFAVFCLSLMNKNNTKSVLEACRVLKEGGTLIIAEIVSRIKDVEIFIKSVESIGFILIHYIKDKWYFIGQFKKVKQNENHDEIILKPFLYKKR